MSIETPSKDSLAQGLESYEPEKYYAVWQHPENRYAYMIGFQREGWLIVMDTEEAGHFYLHFDAALNGRPVSAYRLDELTLPGAFEAVRAQSVPFPSSQGISVLGIKGVEIRTKSGPGTIARQRIPI